VVLALLRRELKRWGFGLLVIYGRWRVGKTALVLKATEDNEEALLPGSGEG
jgi:AAA+ ATPase superfamily predicted ATPase